MYEHAILTANCNFSANMLLYYIMVKIVLVSVSEKAFTGESCSERLTDSKTCYTYLLNLQFTHRKHYSNSI